MSESKAARHVVVVGGGIAGLSAAYAVLKEVPGARVTLLDASDRPGGKLRLDEVAGYRVDVGAEAVLAFRPEATALMSELGLDDRMESPVTSAASVYSRGAVHALPQGTLMGIPGDPRMAGGILDESEIARAIAEEPAQPLTHDVSVADYVGARVGSGVVERLVEPLLGGVYAGRSEELSLLATLPQVAQLARNGASLLEAAKAASAASRGTRAAFAGLSGGMGVLPEHLTKAITARGGTVRSGVTVRSVERTPSGYSLTCGPVPTPEVLAADAVIVAVPAHAAAALVNGLAPQAASVLAEIPTASMAVVTMAFPRAQLGALTGSGFLVPPVEGLTIKASTFSSNKWAWTAQLCEELFFLRTSLGRAGEETTLHRDDDDLVAVSVADLEQVLARRLPAPVASHVQRWGGALPQYTVGHLERVARIRESVATQPGLAVAGAAYDGVGIPATIASARSAAARIVEFLSTTAPQKGSP